MGINIPSNEELIACREKSLADISACLNADSVRYLSVEGLKKAVMKGRKQPAWSPVTEIGGGGSNGHCMGNGVPQLLPNGSGGDAIEGSTASAGLCTACLTGEYPVPIEI